MSQEFDARFTELALAKSQMLKAAAASDAARVNLDSATIEYTKARSELLGWLDRQIELTGDCTPLGEVLQ